MREISIGSAKNAKGSASDAGAVVTIARTMTLTIARTPIGRGASVFASDDSAPPVATF